MRIIKIEPTGPSTPELIAEDEEIEVFSSLKTACKRLSALMRSMFLEFSSQVLSSTASAVPTVRCPAVASRHDKSPSDHLAAACAAATLPAVITHRAMTRAGAILLDKAPFAT